VHGAWADATGFGESIRALRDQGFAVVGAANPLRHLTGDAASLAALLGTISGSIVLVPGGIAGRASWQETWVMGLIRSRR
jgi:hypothetical protein